MGLERPTPPNSLTTTTALTLPCISVLHPHSHDVGWSRRSDKSADYQQTILPFHPDFQFPDSYQSECRNTLFPCLRPAAASQLNPSPFSIRYQTCRRTWSLLLIIEQEICLVRAVMPFDRRPSTPEEVVMGKVLRRVEVSKVSSKNIVLLNTVT